MPVRAFLRDRSGAVTAEFVAIAPFFVVVVFLVIEVTLALFWWQTAEKAALSGVRLAVVHDPAAADLPARNGLTDGALFGTPCRHDSSPCSPFPTGVCTAGGDGCNGAAFANILGRMRELFGAIQAENVTITYAYIGLGYAGGPVVPAVTVTLSGIPFQTGFLPLIGNVIGAAGASLATLPDVSATLTGEDLSAAAVGP